MVSTPPITLSDGGALAAQWARVRADGRAALIPYLTAGYPNRRDSLRALRMVAAEGVDFVEVGIPFSDPLADGPVIQESCQVALDRGTSVGGVLELVREANLPIPVIAFGYLNPLLAYGIERFVDDAREAGITGLLVTDLPVAEDQRLEQVLRASSLSRIRLVALTTGQDRLRDTVTDAEGFIYLISRLGVTGKRTVLGEAVQERVKELRVVTDLPIAIGFGIADGHDAARAAQMADGVVVGSALVHRLRDSVAAARELVSELVEGVRSGR